MQPTLVPSNLNTWAASALGTMDYGLLQYGLILAWEHAAAHFKRAEETRLKASQLEAQLARAQLQALKMQLHPHFLFNTLHTISELIHADPATAETMIVRLSDFLRLTLDHVGIPEVTLMQEVEFVKRYLEIEKMRFEDRLRVEMELDTPTLYARVPNLVLQPLVENALRHGLARRTRDGLLSIRSTRENGHLTIRVFDNGSNGAGAVEKPGAVTIQEGVGISNTRRRLQQIYGVDHSLEMSHQPGGGFEVMIRVPFRLSPQD
ncbi:MAG: hypothetical protein FJW40_11590 [Acidobacteria bacterium]|nr:hypothetical protein [Acidobacteriota bacterium]